MKEDSNKPNEALNATKETLNPHVTAALVTAIASLLVAIITGIFLIANRPIDPVKEERLASADLINQLNIIRDAKKFPFVPPGTIMPYGGTDLDRLKNFGWLLCNGTDYPTNDYPDLFQAVGYSWGRGENIESHFRVPDLQGYFLRGVDPDGHKDPDSQSRTNWQCKQVGPVVGSFQPDEFKIHNHGLGGGDGGGIGGSGYTYLLGNPGSLMPQVQRLNIGLEGGAETRPKNAYVYYIIKY